MSRAKPLEQIHYELEMRDEYIDFLNTHPEIDLIMMTLEEKHKVSSFKRLTFRQLESLAIQYDYNGV